MTVSWHSILLCWLCASMSSRMYLGTHENPLFKIPLMKAAAPGFSLIALGLRSCHQQCCRITEQYHDPNRVAIAWILAELRVRDEEFLLLATLLQPVRGQVIPDLKQNPATCCYQTKNILPSSKCQTRFMSALNHVTTDIFVSLSGTLNLDFSAYLNDNLVSFLLEDTHLC